MTPIAAKPTLLPWAGLRPPQKLRIRTDAHQKSTVYLTSSLPLSRILDPRPFPRHGEYLVHYGSDRSSAEQGATVFANQRDQHCALADAPRGEGISLGQGLWGGYRCRSEDLSPRPIRGLVDGHTRTGILLLLWQRSPRREVRRHR